MVNVLPDHRPQRLLTMEAPGPPLPEGQVG